MTHPRPYLIRMLLFLVLVGGVVSALFPTLTHAFQSNPVLNSFILLVLLAGIAWNLRQVVTLVPEVRWLETFQRARVELSALPTPRMLAPMASMLASREARGGREGEARGGRDGEARFTLSGPASRSMLDSISSRLDESRELSRYMTGLMIFLGLLGTFWGLLETIASVSDVIAGMSVGTGDVTTMFDQLKSGLVKPLRGMGTAFSASMFGLAGALILGFLDLTAGQAQNRFFNELEEWLAGLTRISSGALGEGDASMPVYVQALLEQTAENMENLQHILSRNEEGRVHANQAVLQLTERLELLSETMRTNQLLMQRMAEMQAQIVPALQRLSETGTDDAAITHLRNMDRTLQRLLTEGEQGRAQSTSELRNDIRILTRTVAALAEEQPR